MTRCGVDCGVTFVWWHHSSCRWQNLHETLLPSARDQAALCHTWEGK